MHASADISHELDSVSNAVGDYDVMIPEDTASGMYSIRVGRFEDDSLFGCSDAFEIDGDDSMSMSFRF